MKFPLLSISILCLGALFSIANGATTTIYKSVGKKGEVLYSQIQPKGGKYETLEMRSDGRTADAGQQAQIPDATAATAPSAAESQRIAELEKQVKEQQANEMARHCQNMRANLANLSTGGRVYETNAQGERVYLNDQEISSRRQRTLDAINQSCNGK